jgi:C-terminal processing protease CtpA/Prc
MGDCELPVHVRFVEDVPVVTGFAPLPSGSSMEIKIGDVITQLDGRPVSKLIESWKQYYAGSNDTARMRDVARSMTRGSCGDSKITVRRDDQQITVNVKRVVPYPPAVTHDLPGPAFRLLSKDVAYLKLSSVKVAEAATYVKQSAGTKGLIIDIRNYPSEFVVFALGSLLVDSATPFVRFTGGDLSNPGAFHWTQPLLLSPQQPHYHGRVVVLVDETSLSQAEYTSMAFRGAGAVIVGSTTSGADGNVSPFGLPGGLRTMISGLGVYYPDKQPTQRIGIVPGVDVKPTIAGIRAGRDEVLEQALREILGSQVTEDEIRTLAKPSPAAAGSH